MRTGGILGFLGVGLGALGAHGIKTWLVDAPDAAKRIEWWEIGVRYHLVHALFVLVCAALGASAWATRLAVAGVVLFSGSLYLMTLSGMAMPFAAITPFGGVLFLAAWAMLIFKGRRAGEEPG
jgi:uncharacterized membrane protein YgdD (TMEM256/DUF423 family)